jgi:hypothetical protein
LNSLARIGLVSLVASSLAIAAAAPAKAEIVVFTADLSGAAQVPPAATAGTGTIAAQFDTTTRIFSWQVTYGGLSGPPTAAHFHGPSFIEVPFIASPPQTIQAQARSAKP